MKSINLRKKENSMPGSKALLAIVVAFCFGHTQSFAQMKVGANPTVINAGSVLELESTNQGLYMPRVSLSGLLTDWGLAGVKPVGAANGGMSVYNTNAAFGSGVGLYYWDGTKWNFIANATSINANNGLTFTPGIPALIQLGGALILPTTISGDNVNNLSLTSTATTGKLLSITANSLTSGNALNISSSSAAITTGSLLNISSTGSNAAGTIKGLNSTVTGANLTSIAGQFSSSGATNNYAVIVPSTGGLSGFGTSTPVNTLDDGGSFGTNVTTVAVNGALTPGVNNATIWANEGATITLPLANTANQRIYTIVYKGGVGDNPVTINRSGTNNLVAEGANNVTLSINSGSVIFQSDGGSNWIATTYNPVTMINSGQTKAVGKFYVQIPVGGTTLAPGSNQMIVNDPNINTGADVPAIFVTWTFATTLYFRTNIQITSIECVRGSGQFKINIYNYGVAYPFAAGTTPLVYVIYY